MVYRTKEYIFEMWNDKTWIDITTFGDNEKIDMNVFYRKEEGIKTLKVTIDGMTFEGSEIQITNVLKALGKDSLDDGVHYFSQSKGLMLIKDMDNTHLRNAIQKRYVSWVTDLKNLTAKDFVTALKTGVGSNVTTLALVKELKTRLGM